MIANNRPTPVDAVPIDKHLRAGLALLWQAYTYARDASADLWEFALEIDELYKAGMTISDLRWLATKEYVQHGQETSVYGDAHRSFKLSDGLNFTPATCFVLTPTGVAFAAKALKESAAAD